MLSFTARMSVERCGNRCRCHVAIAGRQPLAVNAGLVKLVLIDASEGANFRMMSGLAWQLAQNFGMAVSRRLPLKPLALLMATPASSLVRSPPWHPRNSGVGDNGRRS